MEDHKYVWLGVTPHVARQLTKAKLTWSSMSQRLQGCGMGPNLELPKILVGGPCLLISSLSVFVSSLLHSVRRRQCVSRHSGFLPKTPDLSCFGFVVRRDVRSGPGQGELGRATRRAGVGTRRCKGG